ncbi:Tigger transposable element-derived protein 7-like 16, partial [Homarus americanus]
EVCDPFCTSVSRVCDEYGVKKQTFSDICKAKDKLIAYSLKYNIDATSKSSSVGARKRMRVAKDTNLEEAVTKWFVQQRSCGNFVRSVEIQAAAAKLASHMDIENFEASDGWLWRFRNRHGMCNKITHGEAGSTPTEDIEPFRERLNDLIKSEGLLISQVYNGDETGLYWRSLPRNNQAFKNESSSPGRKVMRKYQEDVLKLPAAEPMLGKLLYNVEVEYDFDGFKARDFHRILQRAGENDVTEGDIRNWLEDTEGDPGYQVLTEEEIADEVLVGDSRDREDEEDDEPLPKKPKLSVIREFIDNVISYIELSAETDDVQHYYHHIKAFRELIIQRQHHQGKQLKLDSFFKPVRPNPAAAVEPADDIDDPPAADSGHPQSPQPSTSGGQVITSTPHLHHIQLICHLP